MRGFRRRPVRVFGSAARVSHFEITSDKRISQHVSMPKQRLAGNPCLDVLSHCDFDWFLLSRLPNYFCVTRNAIRLFRTRPSSVELSATG